MKERETITMQQLTLAQAIAGFPGCDTDDLKELLAEGQISDLEPDYLRLFFYEGRLFSCVYEISYLGWSEWSARGWHDLENVDYPLEERFREANFSFLEPVT